MPLAQGTKRYQHNVTGDIKYFRQPPSKEYWTKIGTPGSKAWKWISNGITEMYISPTDDIPEGYTRGRLKE